MVASLRESTATFARGTSYKVVFIALIYVDLLLTLFALRHGMTEQNPFMIRLLQSPWELGFVKVIAPIFIAWLVPSRLLLLSIVFMTIVAGWNLGQLYGLI